jgi:hypothetical protein
MPQLTFRATDAHPHEGVIIEVDAFEKIHKVGSIEFHVKRIVAMR